MPGTVVFLRLNEKRIFPKNVKFGKITCKNERIFPKIIKIGKFGTDSLS